MPPRHTYWTILVNDQPTAFRAHDPEELLATLNRLKEKHPSAVMKWFERGKLWESRDAARQAGLGQGERRWEGPRPDRTAEPAAETPRDRSWRPGGDHRDPRQKYTDAKKAKWDRFKQNIRDRAERRVAAGPPGDPQKFSPPHGDPLRDKIEEAPRRQPPMRPEGRKDQPDSRPSRPNFRPERRDFRPAGSEDRRGGWKPKQPPRGPAGWKPKGPGAVGDWRERPPGDRDRSGRPERPRGEWNDRPPNDRDRGWDSRSADSPKPGKPKPWGPKPGGFGGKKPWGTRPGGTGRPKAGGKGPGFRGPARPGGKRPRGPGGKDPRAPRKPRGG